MRALFFARSGAAPELEGPCSSSPDRRRVSDPPAACRSSSRRSRPLVPGPIGRPSIFPSLARGARAVRRRSVRAVPDPRAVVRGRSAPIGAPVTVANGRVRHRAGRVREPDHVHRAVVRGPCMVISLNVYFLQVAHALAREPRRPANFPVADQRVTRAGPQKTGGCSPSGAIARFHTLDMLQNSFSSTWNIDPGPEENHPL